jgi:Domain of unknown function (DUF6471)
LHESCVVASTLRAELKRKGVTSAQLVEKLSDIGSYEKDVNIRNKLARGRFSVAAIVVCLEAIGVDAVRIE